MRQKKQLNWWQGLGILGIIWLVGAIGDRIWFFLDRSVPAWDPADYLNGALNYWRALQDPQWFSNDWWRSFWLISNKIPPLNYILTVPFINLFGTSQDAAFLVMLLHSAILLVSVYGLGVALFNVSVGLWAAGLCQLLPGLYYFRREFLLDYPLAAIVTFSFWLLTLWNIETVSSFWQEWGSSIARKQIGKGKFIQYNRQPQLKNQRAKSVKNTFKSWLLAILFGISFGLALLLKQTALFFLLFPLLWIFVSCLKNRQWLRLTQLITSLFVGVLVFFPWYRTNWLLILTSGKRATIDSAIIEGDPPLNTIAAWTFYGEVLPNLLSWYLLVIAIAGLFLYSFRQRNLSFPSLNKWRWLIVFLVGGYLLSSLNMNKHDRYILPLLPVISLILAVGLLAWRGQKYIRWGTVSLALILMLLNIFPLGGEFITARLSPHYQNYPYTGEKYPHQQVIEEIINTSPYLRSTLGVLPSTVEINQHNFSFYGGQYTFQVVGRQVGIREEEVERDARSLDWFVTKTGYQGSVPEAQAAIVKLVEEGGDFQLQNSWQLPDDSTLKLYHRLLPTVQVWTIGQTPPNQVRLNRVIVPETAPPGVPISVTYEWSGNWEQLQSGIVLLTWQQEGSHPESQWLHDRGIAMGAFDSSRLETDRDRETFQVIERTAMLPDDNIVPGNYILTATYLNRDTGETYPISVPSVKITIDTKAEATPAPELDLVTQLRTIAPNMARGIKGLEPIFAQTTRINQYDAKHDYLPQAELALSYRLQHDNVSQQQKLDWTYAVTLSQVLQQDVDGAIATLKQAVQLNDRNPYNYAYLAFVYLYDWQPRLAERALNFANNLNPHIEEVQTLSGIAALMQGKLIRAWHLLQPVINDTTT
ncbi:phospholipid carrier-dependent glycosyltransferase [Pleurocapsales cyanobacterium LEGE 06147]|nr:phospholipid carrier-dependent glycosyltransferase [Pleurocapsales cyanobacterium LEGE 06147]